MSKSEDQTFKISRRQVTSLRTGRNRASFLPCSKIRLAKMATPPASQPFSGVALLSQLPALPTTIAEANPKRNPLDAFRLAIAAQLVEILPEVKLEDAFPTVQVPSKGADFSVPMPRFRVPGMKPNELAEKVVKEFKPNAYVESVEAKGPILQFTVVTSTLTSLTLSTIDALSPSETVSSSSGPIVSKPSGYGRNEDGKGKNAIVEFSSPNIAKPFHAGHLRSTIIGAFIANLFEANGWYVERWNYLGDWGKQFGLLAVGWERHGSEKELEEDAVAHLYNVYVQINKEAEADADIHSKARAYFKSMEDGEESAVALWRKFRELSIKKYRETYARLNIHFDVYSGESQVKKENIVSAMNVIRESDFIERETNGALLVDLTKYKLQKAIVERADHTPLYITRDIAEAKQRWDKMSAERGSGFDKMMYIVASQQDLHLAQFFKVLELMKYDWAQPKHGRLQHINFGMVLGMSTRKGTAVFLDHILEEAKDKMHEVMRKNDAKYNQVENKELTADIVGMTAVKVQDMAGKRINNYQFDWNRMLSFEGDTGPYLQYNHVRLCSVERRVAETDGLELPPSPVDMSTIRLELITEPKAREVIMLLASWPDIVKAAMKEFQPSTVVQYCFKLTHAVASAWEVIIVKNQEKDVALARLMMYRSARNVLGAALQLLTIPPLQRM